MNITQGYDISRSNPGISAVKENLWYRRINFGNIHNHRRQLVKVALSAMDILRSFKSCGAKGVYKQISC